MNNKILDRYNHINYVKIIDYKNTNLTQFHQRILDILKQLNLRPNNGILQKIKDPTKALYSDIIEDFRNKKFYLKVIPTLDPLMKNIIENNVLLGYAISKQNNEKLVAHFPKLISHGEDYILHEFKESQVAGIKKGPIYSVNLTSSDLLHVFDLIKSVWDFDTKHLEKLSKLGWEFFTFWLTEYDKEQLEINKLQSYIPPEIINFAIKLTRNIQVEKMIESEAKHLSHGDLNITNIIKATNDNYWLIDWDMCNISSKYQDFARLHNSLEASPEVQSELLDIGNRLAQNKEHTLMYLWLFSETLHRMLESASNLRKKDSSVEEKQIYTSLLKNKINFIQSLYRELTHLNI